MMDDNNVSAFPYYIIDYVGEHIERSRDRSNGPYSLRLLDSNPAENNAIIVKAKTDLMTAVPTFYDHSLNQIKIEPISSYVDSLVKNNEGYTFIPNKDNLVVTSIKSIRSEAIPLGDLLSFWGNIRMIAGEKRVFKIDFLFHQNMFYKDVNNALVPVSAIRSQMYMVMTPLS
jgi:hypothetical protein